MKVRLRIDITDAVLNAAVVIHKPGIDRLDLADRLFDRLRPLAGDGDEVWLDVDTDSGDLHIVKTHTDADGLVHFNRVQIHGEREAG
jgi:hypothetical protein